MSKPSRHRFVCPCGDVFDAEVFKSANVTLQPDLKDRILAGRFNCARCPSCGREVEAQIPFLYHDMAANLLIWVYPSARAPQAAAIREKVRRSYEIVSTIVPTADTDTGQQVVFGLDQLLALIR